MLYHLSAAAYKHRVNVWCFVGIVATYWGACEQGRRMERSNKEYGLRVIRAEARLRETLAREALARGEPTLAPATNTMLQ